MKATIIYGDLRPLDKCVIQVPGSPDIVLKILPEITDSKSAQYNDEPVIGRSFPIKTYSHSENRVISMKVHFIALNTNEFKLNWRYLRALQSATYPSDFINASLAPYQPPPVCKIRCGDIFTSQGDKSVCVVLKSCNVSLDTGVVWDEETYIPYKFDVDLNWEVVFSSKDLPGSEKILSDSPV